MPKQDFKCVVVMPVGPNWPLDYVLDNLDSVRQHCGASTKIVIVDDSAQGLGERIKPLVPDADVLINPRPNGRFGGLYVTHSLGYAHALDHYDFEVLLRLDTDALVTGPEPEEDAIRMFKQCPRMGVLGQWPRDDKGEWLSYTPTNLMVLGRLLNPLPGQGGSALRHLYKLARKHGYQLGEHVFGGSFFLSKDCLLRMRAAGFLPNPNLRRVRLEDDHIFGLIVRAVGKDFGDLATDPLPMLCRWHEMPCSPQDVLTRGKKIIHSTHRWQNVDEQEIRKFFRQQRQK